MGQREPQILCIYRDETLPARLGCLKTQEENISIEYLSWDDRVGDKIKDSPYRFDAALLEVEDLENIEQPEIAADIQEYYPDIEIVYFSVSPESFFVKIQQPLPGYRSDYALDCGEIFQLLSFLCRQVQSKREREMLEGLHRLTLEINEKGGELAEILKLTCQTAVEIMKVDHSGFVLFEKDLSRGHVEAEYPELPGKERTEIPVNGIECETRLVFKKEHIDIEDLAADTSLNKELKDILFNWQIRSILIVPVVLNQKVIASFSLDMIKKRRHFYDDEIEFCRKLAAHVALAIGNARHLKEISVLNEIGVALEEQSIRTGDIKKIAETIKHKAAQLVDVRNFFLMGYDEKTDTFELLFHKDEMDDPKKIDQKALRKSLSAYVCRTRKPVFLRRQDLKSLMDSGEARLVGNLASIWLGAPLIARDRVIGVMVVQSYLNEAVYDEHDLTILSTIASQAAIAIDNYQLFHDLSRQLFQINALYATSQEIMQKTPNIRGLLEKIVKEAVEFSQAQAGQFMFYDSSKKVFRVMFSYKLDELMDMEFNPDESMIKQVLKTGKGLFTNDYFGEPFASSKLKLPEFQSKIQGVMEVPLKWKEEIIGILAITASPGSGRIFSQADVEQLEQFASPVATAISIARTISFQKTLLHNSPEAIIALDGKGKITEFNRTLEKILGYSKKDMLGKFVADFYYDGIEETRKIKKILDKGEIDGKPVKGIHIGAKGKNGERIPILFSGAILKDEFEQRIGSIGMLRDLREITNIEKEHLKQQSILAELESLPIDSSIKERQGLKDHLCQMIEKICKECRLTYMVLFAGVAENETVLQPLAWWGLPEAIVSKLPLFNWRKAGLLPGATMDKTTIRQEAKIISDWLPTEDWRKRIIDWIKGQNKEFFQNISCGIPVRLADNYRSLLVFGPFSDQTDLMTINSFLKNIAQTIAMRAMSWLQAIYLQARRRESENALELITHRTRMFLQQIIVKFGLIKQKVEKDSPAFEKSKEGEIISKHTAAVIKHAFTSQFYEMEREDFSFHIHSLSAIVQNCAAAFEEKAREKKKKIELNSTIDYLPNAEVDAHFLSTALENLIENAIKYSFENTSIKIFSSYDLRTATIFVQDIGERLDDRARENLLKPGKRWTMSIRARKIPGSGFGLWDSSVIAAAHEGHVGFSSIPYHISIHSKSAKDSSSYQKVMSEYYRPFQSRTAHLVKVWINIPLKQGKSNIQRKEGDKT